MNRMIKNRRSIYLQLMILLVIALLISAAVFFALSLAGDELAYQYLKGSHRIETKERGYIDELQKYVTSNKIRSDDIEALAHWETKEKLLFFEVYKGEKLTYTSSVPDQGDLTAIAEGFFDDDNYHVIKFSDGEADVFLYGTYKYKVYQYSLIIELLVSFFIFVFIVLIGIRRTIAYIRQLRNEIEILEGGNLDYRITVFGKNELSDLADSLNRMRVSFSDQIKTEVSLRKANKDLVSEVSHDIRTPLTVLVLYTEALRHKKYKNQEQMEQYIERIDDKAQQIQRLADTIFEYSLKDKAMEVNSKDTFKNVFFGVISEMIEYLDEKGYQIESEISWKDVTIKVSYEYISRIADNIVSNICKYAEPDEPIKIESISGDDWFGLSFTNQIKKSGKQEGSQIGIKNIKRMMDAMDGECRIWQAEDSFKIAISFYIKEIKRS